MTARSVKNAGAFSTSRARQLRLVKAKQFVADMAAAAVLTISMFLALAPVAWTVANAFKKGPLIAAYPPVFFFSPTLDNMARVFEHDLVTPFINTAIITAGAVTLAITAGSLAGYALSRFRSGIFRAMGLFVFSMRFMPTIVIILPIFILFQSLGLVGTKF